MAPFGASASVVYFGWVDTDLVRNSLDQGDGGKMLRDTVPGYLLRRISAERAGATIVGALQQRAPRAFAPREWRYLSALRGLLNPLLDRRAERDAAIAGHIRSAEQGARED